MNEERRNGRLAKKIFLQMIVTGVLILTVSIISGAIVFDSSVKNRYTETAYNIGESARAMFTKEEITSYITAVEAVRNGEADPSTLDQIAESPDYVHKQAFLDDLRSNMKANDVSLVYYDEQILENFDQSLYDEKQWHPMIYLFDSYSDSEKQMTLGEGWGLSKDFLDLIKTAYYAGEEPDDYIFAKGTFGYNTTAIVPIVDDGKTIASIWVEIPMEKLDQDLRDYILAAAIVGIVFTLLLLIIGLKVFDSMVIQPVVRVSEAANDFVKNNASLTDHLNDIRTKDEIQDLCQSIMKMEGDIHSYIEDITTITKEKERIDAELNVATRIQADLLPSVDSLCENRTDFDIYANMDPAKEVGGDFYDFFMPDEDHLALVIADVSGKGVPAALFMVIAKTLIKNNILSKMSPKEALEVANEELCANNKEDMFVTAWVGILDLKTGKVVAVNAGHEYPAIRHSGGSFELFKDKHGMVLAAMEGIRYKEYEFELEKGATLFVYTDGVPESTGKDDELYGTSRMLEALNRDPDKAPQILAENVRASIDEFVGDADQFDDLTILAVRRK